MLRQMEALQTQQFKMCFDKHARTLDMQQIHAVNVLFRPLVQLFILGYRKKFAVTFAVPSASFLVIGLILTAHQFSFVSVGLIIFSVYGYIYIEMTKHIRQRMRALRHEIHELMKTDRLCEQEGTLLLIEIPDLKKFL